MTLNEDIREDDAEATLSAIRQIKGVLSVSVNPGCSIDEHIASERLKISLAGDIMRILFPKHNKKPVI